MYAFFGFYWFDLFNSMLGHTIFNAQKRYGANFISEHVFLNDHINNGIMELGNSKQDILTKFFDTAKANSSKWVEGSNEIRTIINGKETTIRFFVKNGEIVNLDGFVGTSSRVIGNLINLIK